MCTRYQNNGQYLLHSHDNDHANANDCNGDLGHSGELIPGLLQQIGFLDCFVPCIYSDPLLQASLHLLAMKTPSIRAWSHDHAERPLFKASTAPLTMASHKPCFSGRLRRVPNRRGYPEITPRRARAKPPYHGDSDETRVRGEQRRIPLADARNPMSALPLFLSSVQ